MQRATFETRGNVAFEDDLTLWYSRNVTVSMLGDNYQLDETGAGEVEHYVRLESSEYEAESGAPLIVLVQARQLTGTRHLRLQISSDTEPNPSIIYDLSSGVVHDTSNGMTGRVLPLSFGWFQLLAALTAPPDLGRFYAMMVDDRFDTTYESDGSSLLLYDMQLRTGLREAA